MFYKVGVLKNFIKFTGRLVFVQNLIRSQIYFQVDINSSNKTSPEKLKYKITKAKIQDNN